MQSVRATSSLIEIAKRNGNSTTRHTAIVTDPVEAPGGGPVTFIAEVCALCVAYLFTLYVHDVLAFPPKINRLFFAVMLIAWIWRGSWRHSHEHILGRRGRGGLLEIPLSLIKTLAIACFALILIREFIHDKTLPKSDFLIVFILAGTVGLFALRFVAHQTSRRLQRRAGKKNRVLVVGNNRRALEIIKTVSGDDSLHSEVVGLLDVDRANPARVLGPRDLPLTGTLDELEAILISGKVDEVLVTLPIKSMYAEAKSVLETCNDAGIRAQILTDIFEVKAPRRVVRRLNGSPTLTYASGPAESFRLHMKRYFDIIGASIGIVLLGIPMLIIALAIKLTSRGPVFFGQTRSGLNGRTFRCLKFRTMVVNADALKASLRDQNEVSGPVFKMRRDPRITRVGRFLRKYSLDELPQLFNVLVGDMSIVGPRPPTPDEVQQYNRWQLRRLSMRPGLTCIWQVSGRNQVGFEDWIQMDLEYIDCWSLLLDFLLIVKTVPAVVRGTGV